MKYLMNVSIVDPTDRRNKCCYKLKCCFVHDEDTYGNGYYLAMSSEDNSFSRQYIDLRYDRSFHSSHPEVWLEQWARNYWTGKNGAYEIESLEIKNLETIESNEK